MPHGLQVYDPVTSRRFVDGYNGAPNAEFYEEASAGTSGAWQPPACAQEESAGRIERARADLRRLGLVNRRSPDLNRPPSHVRGGVHRAVRTLSYNAALPLGPLLRASAPSRARPYGSHSSSLAGRFARHTKGARPPNRCRALRLLGSYDNQRARPLQARSLTKSLRSLLRRDAANLTVMLDHETSGGNAPGSERNLSTIVRHSSGLIREQCPVW